MSDLPSFGGDDMHPVEEPGRYGRSLRERFDEKYVADPNSGCWLWDAADKGNGYGMMRVDGRGVFAHRLSYELFVGTIAEGLAVLHRCDVRACVNPEHLFLGTQIDNMQDAKAKGRMVAPPRSRGEEHPTSKLTADAVLEIRRRASQGERQRDIAADFGISQSAVSALVTRRTWGHIG